MVEQSNRWYNFCGGMNVCAYVRSKCMYRYATLALYRSLSLSVHVYTTISATYSLLSDAAANNNNTSNESNIQSLTQTHTHAERSFGIRVCVCVCAFKKIYKFYSNGRVCMWNTVAIFYRPLMEIFDNKHIHFSVRLVYCERRKFNGAHIGANVHVQ